MSLAERRLQERLHSDLGHMDVWRAEKELKEIIERNRMNWNFIESVEFEGAPKEDLVKVEVGVLSL